MPVCVLQHLALSLVPAVPANIKNGSRLLRLIASLADPDPRPFRPPLIRDRFFPDPKVTKWEIFDRSNFHNFYTFKSLWAVTFLMNNF